MFRAALLAFAVLSAPALASGGYYRAEPQSPPAEQRFVARDTLWNCAGQSCSAARSGSRPAIVCATVVRELGALRSFSAGGEAFDAGQLQACNRRAR